MRKKTSMMRLRQHMLTITCDWGTGECQGPAHEDRQDPYRLPRGYVGRSHTRAGRQRSLYEHQPDASGGGACLGLHAEWMGWPQRGCGPLIFCPDYNHLDMSLVYRSLSLRVAEAIRYLAEVRLTGSAWTWFVSDTRMNGRFGCNNTLGIGVCRETRLSQNGLKLLKLTKASGKKDERWSDAYRSCCRPFACHHHGKGHLQTSQSPPRLAMTERTIEIKVAPRQSMAGGHPRGQSKMK